MLNETNIHYSSSSPSADVKVLWDINYSLLTKDRKSNSVGNFNYFVISRDLWLLRLSVGGESVLQDKKVCK